MPLDNSTSILRFSRPEPSMPADALVDLLGPVDGLHVLVIGPGSLATVLALHAHGAAGVTALRAGARIAAGHADAALLLGLCSTAMVDAAIGCARRAIQPLNSIVVQIAPDAPAGLLATIRQRLAAHGLLAGRVVSVGGSTALSADLPLYGRLKCA